MTNVVENGILPVVFSQTSMPKDVGGHRKSITLGKHTFLRNRAKTKERGVV